MISRIFSDIMSFLNIYKESTLSQLRASLEMCRIVIEQCPEEYWELEIRGHKIGQVSAYVRDRSPVSMKWVGKGSNE